MIKTYFLCILPAILCIYPNRSCLAGTYYVALSMFTNLLFLANEIAMNPQEYYIENVT